MTVSVLIIGDHVVSRQGLCTWLKVATDLHIVGDAGNGVEALALAGTLRPDVVVMDCIISGASEMNFMLMLRNLRSDIRVVMLALYCNKACVLSAVEKGASAYILKDDVVSHLAQAVVAAAAGDYYFSPCLREWVAQSGLINPDTSRRMDF